MGYTHTHKKMNFQRKREKFVKLWTVTIFYDFITVFFYGYEMLNANENYSDERNKCRFWEIYKYLCWLLLCHNVGFVLLNIRVSN